MASNHRSRLAHLLNNRRWTRVLALVIALITWIAVSMTQSPEVERVVKDVPVDIDESVPSQLGYTAFGADDLHVDVTVFGKRYEVGDNVLTANDITVTANTSSVDSPGKYTLQLRAVSNDSDANYTIVAKSQDYIDVYFDTAKSVDVKLTADVDYDGDLVDEDHYLTRAPILSKEKITVTGPTTQINKLDSVVAYVQSDNNLRSSETLTAKLEYLDDDGNELKYLSSSDEGSVTVTIPVYRKTTLPVSVGFTNVPSAYYVDNPLSVTVSPTEMDVGVDPEKLRSMDSISLGDIDFNELSPGENTFTFTAGDVQDGVALNEDDVYTVVVDTGDVISNTLTLKTSRITFSGGDDDTTYSIDEDSLTITVVGPEEVLDDLKSSDLTAVVDLTDYDPDDEDTHTVAVAITIDDEQCWVYGTYTVTVTAEES